MRVKHLLTFAILVLAAAICAPQASSQSTDESICTLGEVRPVLKDSGKLKVERTRKSIREITERTRLNAATTVEVMQGGCAHYGVQIRFATSTTLRSSKVVTDPLLLMKQLKSRTDPRTSVFDTIAEILEAHKGEDYSTPKVLQDSAHQDVTVEVTASPSVDGQVIEISYSFAL